MQRELIEEYNILQEHRTWAERGVRAHDVSQLKLILEEAREFLDRWQGKSGEPQIEKKLTELRENNRRVAAVLESWFLQALQEAVESRIAWLKEEERFRFSVEFIQIVVNASPELRPLLEEIFQSDHHCAFDAQQFYRDSEKAVEDAEREHKRALAVMETDWPERRTPHLRRRLLATDWRQLKAWAGGLLDRIAHAPMI